jgi:hypothetical protein
MFENKRMVYKSIINTFMVCILTPDIIRIVIKENKIGTSCGTHGERRLKIRGEVIT